MPVIIVGVLSLVFYGYRGFGSSSNLCFAGGVLY